MNKVVLVSFMADWCGACRAQDPILEELRKNIGDKVEIIKVDINKDRDIADQWNINATPTLFLLKNNNILKTYIGITSRNELEFAINNILNKKGIY